MVTRKKNQSTHPGIPDMTPSQLASAGLFHVPGARLPSQKKPTKDQQIAALKAELYAAQQSLFSGVTPYSISSTSHGTHAPCSQSRGEDVQLSLNAGGDTEPSTDVEEAMATVGTKRKAAKSTGQASRCVGIKFSRCYLPLKLLLEG